VAGAKKKAAATDAIEEYALAVTRNELVVGRLVRLACERHLRDLVEGPARGLFWDRAAAERAIEFFRVVLRHSKGQFAGQPFALLPWEKFVVGSIFGWKMRLGADTLKPSPPVSKADLAQYIRRFRTAFVSTARKNGKSSLEAGLGLKALVDEDEPGAEVYSAATTRDQAKIVFSEAERMRGASPALRRRITQTNNNLSVIDSASWFRPLSADASKMDGLNVFFALVDEVHEHPNADVIEKLDTGMGARLQPLMYETTTAGVNRQSVCYQHWDLSIKVLEQTIPIVTADRWFAYIATTDEGDDWQDEIAWQKANPSLGALLKIEDLRAEVALAREMPAKQNSIRRLRLNQWTQQVTRWIDMDVWAAGSEPFDVAELRNRPCYGGLDLARVNDLSSLCLLFPPVEPGERWKAIFRHWCPLDDIVRRSKRDHAPYDVWNEQGKLIATQGNTTDFKFIEAEILELAGIYDIRDIAFDRTFAGEIVRNLGDEGVSMVEFGQGFMSMGPATAEFMRRLIGREVSHGGDEVATWCASNVSVRTDPAGNEKPDKERSIERIDPVVAFIMATGRSMARSDELPSVYSSEDSYVAAFGPRSVTDDGSEEWSPEILADMKHPDFAEHKRRFEAWQDAQREDF
jgi:phage terminase large subunit-like protein